MDEDIEEKQNIEEPIIEEIQSTEEEEKSENTAKQIMAYNEQKDICLHVLEQMTTQNSDVTEEQAKLFASSFLAMKKWAQENPELNGQLMADIESMLTIDIRKQSQYDLNAHTDSVAEKMALEKSEELFDKKTDYMVNADDILNDDKRMRANSVQQELDLCQKVVGKLRSGDFPVNKSLDEMIKQHGDIKFNITDDEKIDRHAEIIDKNGEKSVVIDISKEAFENPEVVPFLIAHELGHALDYIDRPAESNGTIKEKEERLADSAAFQMLRGAGYGLDYIEAFVEKVLENKTNADDIAYNEISIESNLITKRAYALAKDIKKEKAAIKSSRVPEGNNNVTYEQDSEKHQTLSLETLNNMSKNKQGMDIV